MVTENVQDNPLGDGQLRAVGGQQSVPAIVVLSEILVVLRRLHKAHLCYIKQQQLEISQKGADLGLFFVVLLLPTWIAFFWIVVWAKLGT